MQNLRYLESEEIDRKKWDTCVETSRAGLIYGFSWYLDIVAPGWAGIVEEDYKSVMPLPVKKRFGINYVFQPVFAQQLGVYGRENLHPDMLASFFKSIPGKIKYIDTNINYTNNPSDNRDIRISKRMNFELSLRKKYANLKSEYSGNNKRNIQRGFPFIELVHDVAVADLIRLKRENTVLKRSREYYEWMNCFAHKLVSSGYAKIAGAIINNKLCAAALFVFYGKRIYYLIPVSDEEGKKNRAMFAIIDHYIQTCSEKDLILDFEGSNISGIARFFEGFGAVAHKYYNIKINRLPFWIRYIKK